jgi:hypothetical protein
MVIATTITLRKMVIATTITIIIIITNLDVTGQQSRRAIVTIITTITITTTITARLLLLFSQRSLQ